MTGGISVSNVMEGATGFSDSSELLSEQATSNMSAHKTRSILYREVFIRIFFMVFMNH
jgi:hypothetical protein